MKEAQNREPKITWDLLPIEEFPAVKTDWDRVNSCSGGCALLDWDFVSRAVRHFSRGMELVVAVCRGEDKEALALSVLNRTRPGSWATFQASQLPIGPWVQIASVSRATLVKELQRTLPGWCYLVAITQQDDAMVDDVAETNLVRVIPYIKTARVSISGTFEEFWARRGKNLRQNQKRQRNRLNRNGVETRLVVSSVEAEVGKLVDDYGLLESRGWKGAAGTALHPDNPQGSFYKSLMQHYASRGEAICYSYLFGDQLVAVDLCIRRDGVLYLLKTTHDEEQRSVSPTMLMRYEIFERIFGERSLTRVEFYGKLMEWHTRWTDEIRDMHHQNFFRWPVLCRLQALKERAAKALQASSSGRSNPATMATKSDS